MIIAGKKAALPLCPGNITRLFDGNGMLFLSLLHWTRPESVL